MASRRWDGKGGRWVARVIERLNPIRSVSQSLFKVLNSEGWGQMRMIPLQAYPAQQWLLPIHKHCTSYGAASDCMVKLSDPRIACKMRALDFEILIIYVCARSLHERHPRHCTSELNPLEAHPDLYGFHPFGRPYKSVLNFFLVRLGMQVPARDVPGCQSQIPIDPDIHKSRPLEVMQAYTIHSRPVALVGAWPFWPQANRRGSFNA